MTEKIKVIGSDSSKWVPIQDGFFFTNHLDNNLSKLTSVDKKNYIEDTVEVLSRSINPLAPKEDDPLSSTGLVIGYIQSGKTASMEGLITLARDNGYQIIILLSGVVSNLTEQTVDRVFSSIKGAGWKHVYKKKLSDFNINNLTSDIILRLKGFKNDQNDPRNETSLIIQMKNKTRINKLTELFNSLNSQYDLSKVPCLIIDDEGDQHSLSSINPRADNQTTHVVSKIDTIESICNQYIISEEQLINLNKSEEFLETNILTIKTGDHLIIERAESAIHRALKDLRKSIPFHSFLSYTATPQASLIVPVIDFLSPKFAIILRAGENYTGVSYFFNEDNISSHTKTIPPDELRKYSEDTIIPPSLLTALKEFFLGVCIGCINREDFAAGTKNRTMMITPSQKVSEHKKYLESIRAIVENWSEILANDDDDSKELYEQFNEVYQENIKPNYILHALKFNDLKQHIIGVLQRTELLEINARENSSIPSINWDSAYSMILVGGIGLERGYTVEGLTVTYMSRPSSRQQDTVQQRARFAGYRKTYKDFIKIYLTFDLRHFYKTYSNAELFLNNSIKDFQNTNNQNLQQWKRVFMARRGTTLTRRNMTDKEFSRHAVRQVKQGLSHELSSEDQKENLNIYEYIKKLPLEALRELPNRPEAERRDLCLITKNYKLEQAQEEILTKIQHHYDESSSFIDANSLITNYMNELTDEEEKSKLELKIILMNLNSDESLRTIRPPDRNPDSRNINIHIGRSKTTGFCGDNSIHYDYLINKTDNIEAVETPTLQVYKFNSILDINDPDFHQKEVVYFCLKLPKTIHRDQSLIRIE